VSGAGDGLSALFMVAEGEQTGGDAQAAQGERAGGLLDLIEQSALHHLTDDDLDGVEVFEQRDGGAVFEARVTVLSVEMAVALAADGDASALRAAGLEITALHLLWLGGHGRSLSRCGYPSCGSLGQVPGEKERGQTPTRCPLQAIACCFLVLSLFFSSYFQDIKLREISCQLFLDVIRMK
jgi:hypothetical protein